MKPKHKPILKPVRLKTIEKSIQWKNFDSKILDMNQNIIFSQKNIQAPAFWSQTAVDIAASKYFYKEKNKEKSIQQLVNRIVSGFNTALMHSKILKSTHDRKKYLDLIKLGLYHQNFAFNSPVWFNCGIYEAYKTRTHGVGHYAYNFKNKKIELIENNYQRPQTSACFIQSVDDSMESIFTLLKTEALLFKYGSGSGTNFSQLRSRYENLKSGGLSSGLISFLEIFDKSAGSIKSGGITRRAAKMVCLDVDHPEIIDFIEWKKNEELKAQALIAGGFSGSFEGEVYKTISGQNSNNSVRLTNQFMNSVIKNKSWNLKYPSNKKIYKKILAKKIWDSLCQSAWACADPGVQFHDTINEFNMCADSEKINASNPCSEFMFLDNTACNLASINLIKFITPENKFDFKLFVKNVDLVFKIQEALVDYSSYPTKLIAERSHRFRPIGLGFANLGSLLMQFGFSYESEQGRALASVITATMTAQCYLTSANLAKELGPFLEYKKNKKSVARVIQKQFTALKKIDWSYFSTEDKKSTFDLWQQAIHQIDKHGLRNAQVTVIAPTGTIGLVMDCGTTGIEPDYSLIKNKKLSGGGNIKMVNPSIKISLQNLNYKVLSVQSILDYILKSGSVKNCKSLKLEHLDIFKTAQGDHTISAAGHLLMMAAVQPFISGAISKTVNLPESATVTDISEVYMKAWKLKLKSVALYRDQSKFIQPLTLVNNKCLVCGGQTILESSCYKCANCGYTSACVG